MILAQAKPKRHRRTAFTLVELMVVMIILSILAGMVISALGAAAERARADRTRTQIKKIHELLMVQWESYRTRPVQLSNRTNPRQVAAWRMWGLRAITRMEMPDRQADLVQVNGNGVGDTGSAAGNIPIPLQSTSALWQRHRRRAGLSGNGANANWSDQFADSECLYLIVNSIQDGNRSALEFFQDSEIGDTDGDGMLELLDAWGRPIRFLRWAPGFWSPMQVGSAAFHGTRGVQPPDLPPMDPFDPLRKDPRANPQDPNNPGQSNPNFDPTTVTFAMYPLVYSAGPDGIYDVFHGDTQTQDSTIAPARPSGNFPFSNDPFEPWPDAQNPNTNTPWLGMRMPNTRGHEDNIHNHLLEVR